MYDCHGNHNSGDVRPRFRRHSSGWNFVHVCSLSKMAAMPGWQIVLVVRFYDASSKRTPPVCRRRKRKTGIPGIETRPRHDEAAILPRRRKRGQLPVGWRGIFQRSVAFCGNTSITGNDVTNRRRIRPGYQKLNQKGDSSSHAHRLPRVPRRAAWHIGSENGLPYSAPFRSLRTPPSGVFR